MNLLNFLKRKKKKAQINSMYVKEIAFASAISLLFRFYSLLSIIFSYRFHSPNFFFTGILHFSWTSLINYN